MTRVKWMVCSSLAAVSAAAAAAAGAPIANLRAQDQRLLRIAEPIMADNVRLCDRTMPDLGVSLQSTDQYPADAEPGFAAPVAFAALLPGAAAAQAGADAQCAQDVQSLLLDRAQAHMALTTLTAYRRNIWKLKPR